MSISDVLNADLDMLRRMPAMPGPSAPRPMSILDFALQDGQLDIMPLAMLMGAPPMTWQGLAPAAPPPRAPEQAAAKPEGSKPFGPPKIQAASRRLSPSAEDVADRNRALKSWCGIFEAMGASFTNSAQVKGPFTPDSLEEFFAIKSTGTIAVRASAWNLFLRYAAVSGLDPSSLDEHAAHEYLSHLKSISAPPSRAPSFLAACHFAFGVAGFSKGPEIAASARCVGSAAISMADLRERMQRDPLQALWLSSAESEIVKAEAGESEILSDPEAVMLGFLVFCLHSRSRCSDAAKVVKEPWLDESEGPDSPECSFVETTTVGSATKTGNSAKKARLTIAIVGLSKGLSGEPWARAWLALRKRLDLDASEDQCLQRELLSTGVFGYGRVKPGQATEWLRFLLLKLGAPPAELTNIGSHSCKATLLSIAAKAGLERDDRRTLGGHAPPNDRSVDAYARDTLAAPLLALGRLLTKIRLGQFDPDSSRSGRWSVFSSVAPDAPGTRCCVCEVSLTGTAAFLCDCGLVAHSGDKCHILCSRCDAEFCPLCDSFKIHKCTKATAIAPLILAEDDVPVSDSDDDSDLEHARMTAEEAQDEEQKAEDHLRFLTQGFSTGSDAAMPPEGVMIHLVHKTAHKATEDAGAACGVTVTDLSYDFSIDVDDLYECKLCWRNGCAPWVRCQTDVPSSEEGDKADDIDPCLFEAFGDAAFAPSPASTP